MLTRPPGIRLYDDEVCADLFAGGGGTSTGIESILGRSPDVAINHNPEALAMHLANHPTTRHIREDMRIANPDVVCDGRRCGFAWFSPDCTHFSRAKGGAPTRDPRAARRSRALAWVVVRWAQSKAKPRVIFVENVEEFTTWEVLQPLGPEAADRRLRTRVALTEGEPVRRAHVT